MTRILALLTAVVLMTAPSLAQDHRWSGLYMGVHAGYGWADHGLSVAHPCNCDTLAWGPVGNETFTGSADAATKGYMGGLQFGAQRQFGTWVVGLEVDVSKTSMDGAHTFRMDYDTDWAAQTRMDWFGTGRIRVGHAFGSLLLYGTGGLAWARTETDMQTISITGPVTMSELTSKSFHVGWAVGGGAEWALTPNLSLKAEYLYVDLGSANYDPKGLAYAGTLGEFKHHELMSGDLSLHIARMGLNYKF
jgi:outer membrane immunogenic protein